MDNMHNIDPGRHTSAGLTVVSVGRASLWDVVFDSIQARVVRPAMERRIEQGIWEIPFCSLLTINVDIYCCRESVRFQGLCGPQPKAPTLLCVSIAPAVRFARTPKVFTWP